MSKAGLSGRMSAFWLVVAICTSAAFLAGFGYRAIREWRRSSMLLVERRSSEAADLLVTALTRDMRSVQRSVLLSAEADLSLLKSPYDVANTVASAFARYPYPETFFSAAGAITMDGLTFFTRSDRPPPWEPRGARSSSFPVSVRSDTVLAKKMVEHISTDALAGQRFSIFEMNVSNTSYQVIARLIYGDQLHERLEGVFGFMVNLKWASQYYFPELTSQVARIGGATPGLSLAVVNERGERISSTLPAGAGPTARRSFQMMFFDPLLTAVGQPTEVRREWSVEVNGAADPTLAAAVNGANRTLLLSALSAAMLVFGMVMTARAVHARANLAELRSEFVSSVTHELKTPIAAIRAAGDTLVAERISSADERREYAQMVVQEAKRLTRLVDNLLALSRITDVSDIYYFEPLALDSLVERSMQNFKQQFEEAGFVTRVDIAADIPFVRADRTAIGLLLDNLIDNAIRYSTTRRSLVISARREDDFVRLDVRDVGRGIPSDEIAFVTRKFFRGRPSISNGSGLGLAIVKRVVAAHGGDLKIQSTPDVGTTVSITLPALRDDEEADSRR